MKLDGQVSLYASEVYSSIIDGIDEALFIHDTETGMILDVNSAMLKMFGCADRIQVVGHTFQKFSHGEHPYSGVEALEWMRKAVENGPQLFRWRLRRLDGALFWGDVSLTFVQNSLGSFVVALVRDVTGCLEKEALLRGILDAVPCAICLMDYREKRFEWISSYIEMITGYKSEELIGLTPRSLFDSEEEYERIGEFSDFLLTRELVEIESIFKRKDGKIIDIFLKATMLDDKILCAILDITDRKKAEKEAKDMEKQLQHVQKLESLGVLAGGIAHDFNNLLMGIMGNAELVCMNLPSGSGVKKNIASIEKAVVKASDLCRQMLAYSGKGKFVIESIYLSHLVEEMVDMLKVSISKNAVLKLKLSSDLSCFEGDASQVVQVVMNLVINASEAIGDKSGVISITTGSMYCDAKYLSETFIDESLPEGRYVYLEVADTGCGMDSNVKKRIFEPFFTTKFTGRGLGMAAMLGIVRGHRGCVKIYSEPANGSTIKVLFPVVEDDSDKENKSFTILEPWKGHGTVLLVDDDEAIRGIARDLLELTGFTVLMANDGRQALDIFQVHADQIRCVILDLTMPHMDGEETFRELRRIKPDAKVIMSSGYNAQEVNQRFLGKGIAGFLQKPYHLRDLQAELKRVLCE